MITHSQPQNQLSCSRYLFNGPFTLFIFCFVILGFSFEFATAIIYGEQWLDPLEKVPSEVLVNLGGLVPSLVKGGQFYRILLASFLHLGLLHLSVNGIYLLLLLTPIEANTNKLAFILTYFLGGIIGNLTVCFYDLVLSVGTSSSISVGCSTSICAVAGLELMYVFLGSPGDIEPLMKMRILTIVGYFGLISFLPGIVFCGHFGGAFVGALMGLAFSSCQSQRKIRQVTKTFPILLISLYTLILVLGMCLIE